MPNIHKIKKILYPASDAVTIYFDKLNGFSHYLPGQHLLLSVQLNGEKISRTYSICTAPSLDDDIAITIRRIQDGKLSGYLVDHAREGMELELEGPFGDFTLQVNPVGNRHLIMIAAGSGITPLYAMLRSILYGEPESSVSLIYANRSFDRIIFHQQLQELEQQFGNRFKLYHAV
jgi:ring-1,2-phenylacetyl-CoA epoxidase subunit PaaE